MFLYLWLERVIFDNVRQESFEGLIKILTVFGACDVVGYVVLYGKLPYLLLINCHFVKAVWFIAQYDNLRVNLFTISVLLQPFLRVNEALLICNVIDKNDARCTFVIWVGKGPKLHISRGVPYLHLHTVVKVLKILLFVIDTICTDKTVPEFTLRISIEQTTFSDPSFTK